MIDDQLRILSAMFAQAPGFIAFLRGPEHTFELSNAAFERLVGRGDLIGKRVRDALTIVTGSGCAELFDQVYRTREPVEGRGVRIDIDRGHETEDVYLDFLCQPIFDANGMIGILIQGHEVTEQRRAEMRQRFLTLASEHLATSADDVETALAGVATAAVSTIADFALVDLFEEHGSRRIAVRHADPKHAALARALVRYPIAARRSPTHVLAGTQTKPHVTHTITREMIVGSTLGPEHLALVLTMDLRSALSLPLFHCGRSYGMVALYTGASGRRFDDNDLPAMEELARVAAVALDNVRLSHERVELLAREQAARGRAEAANIAKDDFLAMLGHELRNPMAPILTAVQLMRLKGDTTSLREQAIIERQALHLVRLLDDLLDVSRIAAGKIQLFRAPVEIAAIAAMAIEIASPLFERKGHELTVDIPTHGLCVDGDETRLTQVIANLLNNAARYTEHGGHVWLSAIREADQVVLRVRDNGIGIDARMLPKIFDLFVQVEQSPERRDGGLGLGLTLVNHLVTMHDGTVTAASPGPGQGSELTVRLPLLASNTTSSGHGHETRSRAGSSQRVLIVDDNVDAAELLGELLNRRGHTVSIVHDGLRWTARRTRDRIRIRRDRHRSTWNRRLRPRGSDPYAAGHARAADGRAHRVRRRSRSRQEHRSWLRSSSHQAGVRLDRAPPARRRPLDQRRTRRLWWHISGRDIRRHDQRAHRSRACGVSCAVSDAARDHE